MKGTLRLFLIIFSLSILFNSCKDDDSVTGPPPSFSATDATDTLHHEDAPFAMTFGIPKASKVNLSIINPRDELMITLIDTPLPAGHHSVLWSPTDEMGAGAYAAILRLYTDSDSLENEYQIVFLLLTRGTIHPDAKQFADEHWDEIEYREYEYNLAQEPLWGDSGSFSGSKIEWEDLAWDVKICYLPDFANTNRQYYPHKLPSELTDGRYWLIAVYPSQFGVGWDDEWGDDPNSPSWNGESLNLQEYRTMIGIE